MTDIHKPAWDIVAGGTSGNPETQGKIGVTVIGYFDDERIDELIADLLQMRGFGKPALKQDSSREFTLDGESCWIAVDDPTGKRNGISVWIRPNDEGVMVDLYPRYREMDDQLSGVWATFAEATSTEEDNDD